MKKSPRRLQTRTALTATFLLLALVPTVGVGVAYSYATGLKPEGSLLGVVIAAGAVLTMPYLWLEKRSTR
ncbi:MAG: hypothetical protein JRN06_03215 [Nitrososphaerota archaeon]|nr:hypothetical protein [Nitrososphaerota archaeon]MDG7023132.1 hypothetical protein [Nitrososphaerota archaeon]